MATSERGMPLVENAPGSPYDNRIQRLAFLAPDIQRAIIEGRQPIGLNLERLVKTNLPLSWIEQREALGFELQGAPCSAP